MHNQPESAAATRSGNPLLITRCTGCDTYGAPMAVTCAACHGTDLISVPSAGTGAIVSWKNAPLPDPDPTPAVIAIVLLDEGPRVYTWIEGEIPTPAADPVRVAFRPTPHGDRFPVFAVHAA